MTDKQSLASMKAMYIAAKKAYYETGKDLMTDAAFDKLEEALTKLEPAFTKGTGIVGKKSPIELSSFMPSLEKCKSLDGDLTKYLKRTESFNDEESDRAAIMDKLDGGSVLASYKKGVLATLATRGDGVTGKNITFLAQYCRNIPKKLKVEFTGDVRMEAILRKNDYVEHYAEDADSARAAVSGALNRQTPSVMLRDIRFVALRVLTSKVSMLKGLTLLAHMGFETVRTVSWSYDKITKERLDNLLTAHKDNSPYEMDGLVVHSDCRHLAKDSDKPKFAFAYKLDTDADEASLATITDVEWKVSAFGVVVPKAIITPVNFDGVTVKQVALHNFQWAEAKGCGVGAIVRVIRSGDIIPKIVKLEKTAVLKAPKHLGKLVRDGVNLVIDGDNAENYDQVLKRFFSSCELDGFGPALAKQLADHNTRTYDVCNMTSRNDWGMYVGDVVASKLAAEVIKFRARADLATVMAACGEFDKGIGSTRLASFIAAHGVSHFVDRKLTATAIAELASTTPGCGPSFAANFRKGLLGWEKWLAKSTLTFKVKKLSKKVQGKLSGKCYSFTGYRNAAHEQFVTDHGGTVVPFGSKTNVLFYSPSGKASSKVEKAREKGVQCVIFEKLFNNGE